MDSSDHNGNDCHEYHDLRHRLSPLVASELCSCGLQVLGELYGSLLFDPICTELIYPAVNGKQHEQNLKMIPPTTKVLIDERPQHARIEYFANSHRFAIRKPVETIAQQGTVS